MKKLGTLFALALLLGSLTACSSSRPETNSSGHRADKVSGKSYEASKWRPGRMTYNTGRNSFVFSKSASQSTPAYTPENNPYMCSGVECTCGSYE